MSGCGVDRGPKMLMDPGLHRDQKPDWIRVRLPHNPAFWSTKSLITDLKLVTVCEEAQCPNIVADKDPNFDYPPLYASDE